MCFQRGRVRSNFLGRRTLRIAHVFREHRHDFDDRKMTAPEEG